MIVFKNKRTLRLCFALVLLLAGCIGSLTAQDTLQTIEINASKNNLAHIGKKTETLDSTLKEQFRFNSAGDALSFNSPLFIKSYGPGALATTALRGGNASQTAVLWNGFNLQNAMLGQADLSLMPAFLFEEIGIEYGGSSALWGSGAVGGSIHLNNGARFGKGIITSTNLGAGSFGMRQVNTAVLVSKQRFISSTKVYATGAQNNFSYRDTADKLSSLRTQQHAAYNMIGIMQELRFMINQRQIVSLNAWVHAANRELPSGSSQQVSKASQRDEAFRVTGSWNYVKTGFRSSVRAASFTDNINYNDSIAAVYSKSRVYTFIAENENYLEWHKANQFNFGVNATGSRGITEDYGVPRSQSRVSLLAGNKFSFLSGKLICYAAARAEYFSAGTLPVTGNVSAEYKLLKGITLMANAARVYRQPTLNELYWVPGGNPHLKPEQGYTFDGTVTCKKQAQHVAFLFSAAAYSRNINNWILWTPGAYGVSTPLNIQQVWSRGTETTWKINYSKNRLKLGAGLITGYVLSTVLSNDQENNGTKNKQLIYTPRYTFNGNLTAGYGPVNLVFFQQYIGYRFTTSDNSEWLPPFCLSSLRANCTVAIKNIRLILYAAVNNVFNSSYSVLAGRPMPLRHYEIGITLQTKNRKNP